MSFSNSSGGTLALPSPTHAHQIDVTSAVGRLRRSISRSPSKFLSRASSHGPGGSRQASPQSPCRRFGATPQSQLPLPTNSHSAPPAVHSMHTSTSSNSTTPPHPSIIFTPLRSSVKLSLRSAKSAKTASPSRPLARIRASPKSPLKRALNAASDSGNSLQTSASSAALQLIAGQENTAATRSPAARRNTDKPATRHSLHVDVSGAGSQYAFLRNLDSTSEPQGMTTTGALKRSDATMNLDHPNQGSPVAKRRSMHGISSLGQTAVGQTTLGQTEDLSNIFGSNTTSSQSFEIHEDSLPEYELSGATAPTLREQFMSPTTSSNHSKRTSLRKSTLQQRYGDKGSFGRRMGERQLANMNVDPSSPARARPRLSTDHFVPPHISRDSPFTSNPMPSLSTPHSHQPHPLSKTLTTSSSGNSLTEEVSLYAPAKFTDRPKPHPFARSLPVNATRPSARTATDPNVIATPNHGDKLWIGAFHSTGLVSKVNRNPEEEADKKIAPPDTPCKKHSNPFATFPPPSGSALKKKVNNRNSFAGLPSTPFNPTLGDVSDTFGKPGKGLGIFRRGSATRSARRGSFLTLEGAEGEDRKLFGELVDFSNPSDDVPPTPTKNTLTPSFSNLSSVSERSVDTPSANRTFVPPMSAVRPTVSRQSTVSPVNGRRTPQTPQESALPLDTSRLSLSHAADGLGDSVMAPPVTPTTGRDFRSSTSHFVTPVNARTTNLDIDASLYSRFDKVEQVGKGEFSTVYRVTKFGHLCAPDATSTTPGQELGNSPAKGQIFAVKKSKYQYIGPKDRETKLREVHILQALSHAEHVVHYLDDWEHNHHLYIQTEFCEEGTLDKFLGMVGREGRLDDFRIFKILHDLCSGLKEIHEAGFMHLDMKPANILITFEGALKIGDFGLAQSCLSLEGVDVEGDREYMAPEMLQGKAGQSADIFSLGLITLEAAANVVLPDNGPTWVALRSGDLSEVPSLTWNFSSNVDRNTLVDSGLTSMGDFQADTIKGSSSLFGSYKREEPKQQPDFMVNAFHPSSLDSIVRWMTAQDPAERPFVDRILQLEGLRYVAEHRNAPATVFEGNWGPTEPFAISIEVDSDTEMTGV